MTSFKVALVGVLLAGCGGGDGDGTDTVVPDAPGEIDAAPSRALTLADVIAPVTPDEITAARAEYAARDLGAYDVVVEASGTLMIGQVEASYRVLSHTVEGQRHYGAVLVPTALTAPAPVLIYTHGGYTGPEGLPPVSPVELGNTIPGQPLRAQFVYVIPSYRGERIAVEGTMYTSEGTPLIGTTDVTDTAALLAAALESTPLADPERIAILGGSRGGIVALAFGANDARIDALAVGFAPTDFRIALAGVDAATFEGSVAAAAADPDNIEHLLTRSLVPIREVTVTDSGGLEITAAGYAEMRRRMAATSAIATPLDLPMLQLHHGTADTTASVAYSRALADAMAAAGRPSPSTAFTYYEYEGGAHGFDTLPGSIGRIGTLLERL